MQWILDNALGIISAAAATVAAIASVWGVRLLAANRRRPEPIVSVELSPVMGQSGWFQGTLEVRNRADAPLQIVRLAIRRPNNARILSEFDGLEVGTWVSCSRWALPVSLAERTIDIGATVAPDGTSPIESLVEYDPTTARVYFWLHLPRSSSVSRASMRLILSWRDRPHRQFQMLATTIVPAENTISPVESQ